LELSPLPADLDEAITSIVGVIMIMIITMVIVVFTLKVSEERRALAGPLLPECHLGKLKESNEKKKRDNQNLEKGRQTERMSK